MLPTGKDFVILMYRYHKRVFKMAQLTVYRCCLRQGYGDKKVTSHYHTQMLIDVYAQYMYGITVYCITYEDLGDRSRCLRQGWVITSRSSGAKVLLCPHEWLGVVGRGIFCMHASSWSSGQLQVKKYFMNFQIVNASDIGDVLYIPGFWIHS